MAKLKYDILALDLDGTLLGPDGEVSRANIEAVARAREAGIEVVICTGRGYRESWMAIEAVEAKVVARGRSVAPIVVSGGAMIVDAATDRTMHRWPVDLALVEGLCSLFAEQNRAPLLLKDFDAAGYDYLVVNSGPIEPPTQWWFEHMPVEVRFVGSLLEDEHPEHTVRVGFAASTTMMRGLAASVRERFGRRALIHSFAAVSSVEDRVGTDGRPIVGKDENIHLLEVFDAQVSKWTAIHRLALEQGIPRDRVAAIGDEINDLALIEGAGLGIAMGNAIDEVKRAAQRETLDHGNDGVAHAIDRILTGAW
ncbi:MAG: HAD hydrolase family protein [Phycisphaerales bacterium]